MESLTYASVLAVIFGFIIEAFFKLIKYKDSLNSKYPVPVTAYGEIMDASNYMSVSRYLSGGRRKWANYFLFRLLPPMIILILLAGVLNKYLSIHDEMPFILLASAVSLLMRDFFQIFNARLVSERLLHFANTTAVLVVSYSVAVACRWINFSFIAPSVSGLVDNLWSSLLVALLVILYFRITNMGGSDDDKMAEDIAVTNYVLSSKKGIESRFSKDIIDACKERKCSIPLLYAVLIYENMNRPSWLRIVENAFNVLPGVNLTVGLHRLNQGFRSAIKKVYKLPLIY